MKASRAILLVVLALLAAAALRDVARLGAALPWRQLYDFADFYCAGAALDAGADPYRYEPLHRCEHAVDTGPIYRNDPARVTPAPLPPYDFPPFMLAARLNFATARQLDAVAIAAAVVAAILAMGALVPLEAAALALLLPAGYVSLNAGQVVPFALLALIFCGVALARGRDAVAGVLGALVAIEPHLGLPVCAALLLWLPRSRVPLVATAVVLLAAGVFTVGPGASAEYVSRVLPAQAAAEVAHPYQYSLTYLLHTLGVPANAALIVGDASYAAMLVVGVWLGRRLKERLARPEMIAFAPAACSVIGGPYVHMVDLPFAIPAALVLAFALRGNARQIVAVALCLLAIPWILVWITKKLFLASLFVVVALLLRVRTKTSVALATFGAVGAAIYLLELAPPAPLVATTPGTFAASDLASAAWTAYANALPHASLTWLAVKVPTWAGLIATIVAAWFTPKTSR
ncbi:MAG TPA: glycosyltransferase 87 family protein [Candidatus Cybelea sp.]